jgi:hypothetical protein
MLMPMTLRKCMLIAKMMFGCASAVSASLAGGQATSVTEDQVAHFGPLVVVACHEAVRDPEKIARTLLDEGGAARLKALQELALESDTEIKAIWRDLLTTHKGIPAETLLQDTISTSVPDLFFGEGPEPQKRVSAGFDTLSDQPFWIDAVFSEENGQWYRVATLACRCKLMDLTEPAKSLSSKRMVKPEELVYRIDMSPENDYEWHLQEVRFRLHGGILKPVVQYEAESWKCPDGYRSGHLCTGTFGNLNRSALIDPSGRTHAGALLFTGTQTSHMKDHELARVHAETCTPYLWDETAFEYRISTWRAKGCMGHAIR